ncbi:uncharacterized protein LOC120346365 isoform X2 [Styela clava]|uniref:E3 ubiquitin-protein ligase RNF4-like isoform X2 n=1 Tax=Styela clava TaxID=7725 RepID=UPI00193AC3BF|nr:E3 ubiquitin-protein ligase RNF4-like isoform X2 [Styela clava]
MMTENSPQIIIGNNIVTDSGRSRRLRRNMRRSSADIIVLDSPSSPTTTNSSVIPRRRRRMLPELNTDADTSIVDLTCSPDAIVDLTSPDFNTATREPAPVTFEISDGEEELNESVESPTPTQPALSCPVCLERFSKIVRNGGQVKSTICGHIFCNVCIATAIHHNKKCPTCRKKLDSRKVHTLYLPV